MKKNIEDIIIIGGFGLIVLFIAYASYASDSITVKLSNLNNQNTKYIDETGFVFPDMPTKEIIKDTEIEDTGRNHIVERGDTVYSIGRKYNISPIKIIRLNNCGKCNALSVGEVILIE